MSLPESEEELLLLHNPRCSKSRATLALLEERGVDVAVRLYLEDPLSRDEIVELGRRLGKPVAAFTRQKQAEFAEAGLDAESTDEAIAAAMASHPILLERPILVRGGRAAIGRPPEDVLALIDG